MRNVFMVALLSAVLPFGAYAARLVEMKSPVTIPLTTKASNAQVKKAVKLAVLSRQWTISNEKGNEFDATYTRADRRSNLMAKIRVSYTPSAVTIKYLNSEGLSAEGNQIHPTYNKWIANLEKDIPIYLEREVVASE